jgi:hypothetical protein
LTPGTYRLTATVHSGTCTLGHLTITGGETVYHDLPCLLHH